MASLDEIENPEPDPSEKGASPPQSPFALRRTSSRPSEEETEGYFVGNTVDSFVNNGGSNESQGAAEGFEVIPDNVHDTETDSHDGTDDSVGA